MSCPSFYPRMDNLYSLQKEEALYIRKKEYAECDIKIRASRAKMRRNDIHAKVKIILFCARQESRFVRRLSSRLCSKWKSSTTTTTTPFHSQLITNLGSMYASNESLHVLSSVHGGVSRIEFE